MLKKKKKKAGGTSQWNNIVSGITNYICINRKLENTLS